MSVLVSMTKSFCNYSFDLILLDWWPFSFYRLPPFCGLSLFYMTLILSLFMAESLVKEVTHELVF